VQHSNQREERAKKPDNYLTILVSTLIKQAVFFGDEASATAADSGSHAVWSASGRYGRHGSIVYSSCKTDGGAGSLKIVVILSWMNGRSNARFNVPATSDRFAVDTCLSGVSCVRRAIDEFKSAVANDHQPKARYQLLLRREWAGAIRLGTVVL
jgi:hypothetical protein